MGRMYTARKPRSTRRFDGNASQPMFSEELILEPITFEELIITCNCNLNFSGMNKIERQTAIKKQFNEILRIKIDDAAETLRVTIDKIEEEA